MTRFAREPAGVRPQRRASSSPSPSTGMVTSRVLVMSFIDGHPRRRRRAAAGRRPRPRRAAAAGRAGVARRRARSTACSTVTSTPATSWSRRDGDVAILDFGIMGELDDGAAPRAARRVAGAPHRERLPARWCTPSSSSAPRPGRSTSSAAAADFEALVRTARPAAARRRRLRRGARPRAAGRRPPPRATSPRARAGRQAAPLLRALRQGAGARLPDPRRHAASSRTSSTDMAPAAPVERPRLSLRPRTGRSTRPTGSSSSHCATPRSAGSTGDQPGAGQALLEGEGVAVERHDRHRLVGRRRSARAGRPRRLRRRWSPATSISADEPSASGPRRRGTSTRGSRASSSTASKARCSRPRSSCSRCRGARRSCTAPRR